MSIDRRLTQRIATILGALALMSLVTKDLIARGHGEATYQAAQAIAGGYAEEDREQHSLPVVPGDPQSPGADRIRADEMEAGAIWAKAHGAATVGDCPRDSHVFYVGCVAAVSRTWPEP